MFTLAPHTVEDEARRAAGWLHDRGLRRGDRVAVVAGNRPGFVALTSGALRTGVIPVLVNAHLGADERARIVADAEPALTVTEDTWPDWSDATPMDLAPVALGRPMHYTSGTTGVSKGVWGGVLSDDEALALSDDEQELWAPEAGDIYLVCSPLHHSAPHRVTLSALHAGAEVVVFERFDAPAVAAALERAAGAFLVPTHLRRLLDVGVRAPAARRLLHAGEPCPEVVKRRALEVFPDGSLWEFYGSTEGQFTLCSPDEWLDHPGTVGRARTGRTLSVRDGRVFVSAPAFARWSYWKDPAATADAWDGDAFTVGDVGRIDEGFLYLDGRRHDLIISGGVNVYPAEVERVAGTHPGVREVAVFGVDDPHWGQRVCAVAVLDGVGADELRDWLRERLPGSHTPKQVVAVDELPRTASGKVRRTDLGPLLGQTGG